MRAYLHLFVSFTLCAYFLIAVSRAQEPDFNSHLPTSVTEVIIESANSGSELKIGRGWALSLTYAGKNQCVILTPFHVVGDRFDGALATQIRASAPGSAFGSQLIALDPAIQFPDLDLAVLKVPNKIECPFILSDSNSPALSNDYHLRRLATPQGGIEEKRGNEIIELLPADASGIVAKGSIKRTDLNDSGVVAGWSGSTVVRNKKRIGLVTSTTDSETFYFLTVGGIQKLLGSKLNILTPVQNPAITALSRRGLSLSKNALVDVLISADLDSLLLIENANPPTAIIEAALASRLIDNSSSVAYAFFDKTRGSDIAIDWFKRQLSNGLDPTLLVGGKKLEAEAILIPALKAANIDAVKALLEAGADPNPHQILDGADLPVPQMINPFFIISELHDVSRQNRQELAKVLIEAGAIIPDRLELIYTGQPYKNSEWADRYATDPGFLEAFAKIGLNPKPTDNLCYEPRPKSCAKASSRTGYDWCAFTENLPKGFTYNSISDYRHNPYSDPNPFILNYFLGADTNNAYFLSRSRTNSAIPKSTNSIIGVSRDKSSISILSYDDNRTCKEISSQNSCWRRALATQVVSSKLYTVSNSKADWLFFDFCTEMKKHESTSIISPTRYNWLDDLEEKYAPLRGFVEAIYSESITPSSENYERVIRSMMNGDSDLYQKYSAAVAKYPDAEKKFTSYITEKNKTKRRRIAMSILHQQIDWRALIPGTDYDIRGLSLLGLDNLKTIDEKQLSEEKIREKYESAITHFTKELHNGHAYIVSNPTKAHYNEKIKAVHFSQINSSHLKPEEINFLPFPEIKRLSFTDGEIPIDHFSSFPSKFRSRHITGFFTRGNDLRIYRRLRRQPPNSFSSKSIPWLEAGVSAVAMDRVISIPPINISEEAFKELEKRRITGVWGTGWKIITLLSNIKTNPIKSSYGNRAFLEAKIDGVLIVGPDHSVVKTIPGDHFAKAAEVNRITNQSTVPRKENKGPVQLTGALSDILLVAQNRELPLEQWRRMFINRWNYELETENPVYGSFFNKRARGIDEAAVTMEIQNFKSWMISASAQLDKHFFIPITVTSTANDGIITTQLSRACWKYPKASKYKISTEPIKVLHLAQGNSRRLRCNSADPNNPVWNSGLRGRVKTSLPLPQNAYSELRIVLDKPLQLPEADAVAFTDQRQVKRSHKLMLKLIKGYKTESQLNTGTSFSHAAAEYKAEVISIE